MKGPLFFAKILLFGEYGIIIGSKGLSIPFFFFGGRLRLTKEENETTRSSNQSLCEYTKYLAGLSEDLLRLDWEALKADLDRKLYFDSNIPQGYGVGSSGALVAAFYDRYALEKTYSKDDLTSQKLTHLKNIFATMESHFHGQSSGLDPLNSYLSLPLLIHSKENIELTGILEQNPSGEGAVFLIDTGSRGVTAPMVSLFMEHMKEEGFRKMMNYEFTQITDLCIENFLKSNLKSLFENMKSLSTLVLRNFKPMIPLQFHGLWKKGLETNAYYLKLCGSGGGGYLMGFTPDLITAKKLMQGYQIEVVHYF